jgi:hypothetical protein
MLAEHVRLTLHIGVVECRYMQGDTRSIEVRTTNARMESMLKMAREAVCHHTGRRRVWNNAGIRVYTAEVAVGLAVIRKVGIYDRRTGEEYTNQDHPRFEGDEE